MKQRLILFITALILSFNLLNAVPAYHKPIIKTQPDGTQITILLHGDEFFNYMTTSDGYLIIEDNDGYFRYAQFDNQAMIHPTKVRAKNQINRSVQDVEFTNRLKKASVFEQQFNQISQKRRNQKQQLSTITNPQKAYPTTGSPRALVILVNFSDKEFATPNPNEAFTNLLNEPGYSENGGTGSAKDYFNASSNGLFDPVFDIYGPYELPNDMAFYGANGKGASDVNPVEMIVDACKAAHDDGVDFTLYDTDNDGILDNVFVYYAGHNEAEGGGGNTIWPHRWVVYPGYNYFGSNPTSYDGVRLNDYACTSELGGYSGKNMAGIGTFVHEFSHVLGLPDFYATNGASHFTLNSWDVMDVGPYLNNGRTPPLYSAYERFFTGWLTPEILETPGTYQLETPSVGNQTYLISSTDSHNLNGKNPKPTEFFLLENRQRVGFDAYLPGQGMLITRINYSKLDWDYNVVNNTSSKMGVDIIEADGKPTSGTMSGDTYPGTAKVKNFIATLRDGTDIKVHITDIEESDGVISFNFNELNIPEAYEATEINPESFVANWGEIANAQKYLLDVYQYVDDEIVYIDGYNQKDVGLDTSLKIEGLNENTTYYYRVSAVNRNNTSDFSNEIEVQTIIYTLDMFAPAALDAKEITAESFKANWSWLSKVFKPETYYITVYNEEYIGEIEMDPVGFNGGVMPDDWDGNFGLSTTFGYYGKASPAVLFEADDHYLQTPVFENTISKVKFWYRGRNALGNSYALQVLASVDGRNWSLFKEISPVSSSKTEVVIDDPELSDFNSLKFVFVKPDGAGSVVLDDIEITLKDVNEIRLPDYDMLEVGDISSFVVSGLENNVEYVYYVVAGLEDQLSSISNRVKVYTEPYTSVKDVFEFTNIKLQKGDAGFYIFSNDNHSIKQVELYNINGQKVFFESTNRSSYFIPVTAKGIYLLKADDEIMKVLW